jgi:hypothetical protein
MKFLAVLAALPVLSSAHCIAQRVRYGKRPLEQLSRDHTDQEQSQWTGQRTHSRHPDRSVEQPQ